MREAKQTSAAADREARAKRYLEKAKERKSVPKPASSNDNDLAICVAHGLPECSICRKLEARDRSMGIGEGLLSVEVENTSLQIGCASKRYPASSRPPTRGSRPPTRGSASGNSSRAPLSEIEQQLQAKLFRHQRGSIEDACRREDETGSGFLTREQFAAVLGGLMLHPGEREFTMLWYQYVPTGTGSISHISWLQRFVASVSLPAGMLPPCVTTKGSGGATSRSSMSSRRGLDTQRSVISCASKGSSRRGVQVPPYSVRSHSSKPGSSAGRMSIDCAAAPLSKR